jgi:hypothetical protein
VAISSSLLQFLKLVEQNWSIMARKKDGGEPVVLLIC